MYLHLLRSDGPTPRLLLLLIALQSLSLVISTTALGVLAALLVLLLQSS